MNGLVRPAPLSHESGSATVWMISVVSATFLLIGLVLDGGTMLRARSDAFAAAGAAARAGAQELDQDAAVEGKAVIDPIAAQAAAKEHLRLMGVEGSVSVEGETVTVTARAQARLQLLRLVSGETSTFSATATAEAAKVGGP